MCLVQLDFLQSIIRGSVQGFSLVESSSEISDLIAKPR